MNRGSHLSTCRSPWSRRGFTLMEVLLALALCSVVLAAAFSAIHLSWKYRSSGTLQAERSQIVRGVFQDMTLDLRSVVRYPEAVLMSDKLAELNGITPEMIAIFNNLAKNEDSQFEALNDIEERILQFDSVGLADPIHFFGDTNFFVMLSDSANYRFVRSVGTNERQTLQQHVVWLSHSGRSVRIPFSVSDGQLHFTTLTAKPSQTGLLRMSQTFDARTASRSNQTIAADWTRIIPDSYQATFRYSNGAEWKNSWNSQNSKRCPAAVEVTLRSVDFGGRDAVRFVIRLPRAWHHSS